MFCHSILLHLRPSQFKDVCMPNRIVREAILTSEPVCSLGWPEEVFYRRLMSIVDDYGRSEANPQLLRSRCYPLQTDQVRNADLTRWIAACEKAGLIVVYDIEGKRYLQIEKFGQQLRSASKCPPPPDGICNQLISDAHLGVSVSVAVSEGVSDKARTRATLPDRPDDVSEQTWGDWIALRNGKRAAVSATVVSEARREADKAGITLERFLSIWCVRGTQGLQADWLKPAELKRTAQPASKHAAAARAIYGAPIHEGVIDVEATIRQH